MSDCAQYPMVTQEYIDCMDAQNNNEMGSTFSWGDGIDAGLQIADLIWGNGGNGGGTYYPYYPPEEDNNDLILWIGVGVLFFFMLIMMVVMAKK